MEVFLYTWNPKKWIWVDFADAVYRVNNGEGYDTFWSTGNRKKIIKAGDIFFLMRLGGIDVKEKGIIGWGYVLSKPEQLPHWDEKKLENNQTTLKSEVLFKDLSDVPLITLNDLEKDYPDFKWTPQSSGIKLPDIIQLNLMKRLCQISQIKLEIEKIPNEIACYKEGKVKTITVTTYDRSTQARQKCIECYGYICTICGFDFEQTYGEIGKTYIEVHHLKPISENQIEYMIHPINDLRPVCANCHRMLHRRKRVLSIEELRQIVNQKKLNSDRI